MFAPVKLSLEVRDPGVPRWAAEFQAADGMRLVGFGDNPSEAMGELAGVAMQQAQGSYPPTTEEAAAYFGL